MMPRAKLDVHIDGTVRVRWPSFVIGTGKGSEMRMAILTAAILSAVCGLAGCTNAPGADGRYAHTYTGRSGEGGTGLPITPYVPR